MIRYRALFTVDITHDFFLSRGDVVFEAQAEQPRTALSGLFSVSQFLEIVPDAATAARLRGHRMIFRTTPEGFLVAAQLDASAPDIRPAVPPGPDFQLSFALRATDPRFANYTELGTAAGAFLRFSNASQNRVVGGNYLSTRTASFSTTRRYAAGETRAQANGSTFDLFVALRDTGPSATPVPADWRRIPADTHDPATTYLAGDLVLSSSRLFRALIDSPGTNLANAAEWQPVGSLANQYAGGADAVPLAGGLFGVELTAAALTQATLRVLRAGQVAPVSEQAFMATQGVLGEVQLDLRGFEPGAYTLEVRDASLALVAGIGGAFYLSPRALAESWLGVIDIGNVSGDFALLNPDGTLRDQHYALRFLNRATRWRYIFPAAQAVGSGADVAPEPGSDRRLVTAAARPLTLFGSGVRLQADDTATTNVSEQVLLPAPEPLRLRRQNAEWFSETHLPNLTVGP